MTTTAKEAVAAVSNFANSMSHNKGEFVAEMNREHRTLQQGFTGLALAWLMHLSQLKDNECDARNAASVEIARKMMKGMDKYDIQLPFI